MGKRYGLLLRAGTRTRKQRDALRASMTSRGRLGKELPAHAKTVYGAAGLVGLVSLVRAGMLEPGQYLCPICDGGTISPPRGTIMGDHVVIVDSQCGACAGLGAFVLPDAYATSQPQKKRSAR